MAQYRRSSLLVVPTVIGLTLSPSHETYLWAYDTFYVPLNASIVGLGVFWLCSASYRAFRVRNIHAVLLLVSAIIMMIGSMGLGKEYLPFSTVASEWLNSVIGFCGHARHGDDHSHWNGGHRLAYRPRAGAPDYQWRWSS